MLDQSKIIMTRRAIMSGGVGFGMLLVRPGILSASDTPINIDPQPYFDHAKRLIEAMRLVGEPLMLQHEAQILSLAEIPTAESVRKAELIFGHYTLMRIRLDETRLGQADAGGAPRQLIEQGWRSFLIRIENPFGLREDLQFASPSALEEGELVKIASFNDDFAQFSAPAWYAEKWLGYQLFTNAPLTRTLSGAGIEYRILQLYSRVSGQRSAHLEAHAADIPFAWGFGPRRRVAASFACMASRDVSLGIKDWDGAGVTASFLIRDTVGRLYPAPAHRLEPDLGVHPQIYRADGESVKLPAGDYEVMVWRGPEYLKKTYKLTVDESDSAPGFAVQLVRWINAAALGWHPGDTHMHPASFAPLASLGITPETMVRHVRGEALAVGSVLIWTGGYAYHKQFLTGHVYEPTNLLPHLDIQKALDVSLEPKVTPHDAESMVRYDVEHTYFPSSHSGHPVLLRLKHHNYPGATSLNDWPSWNLPVLRWAKEQGAIAGYAHIGQGLAVGSTELPNYEVPAFDSDGGDGAHEYLVDVAHGAVDFVSGGELHSTAELNLWYHALNCGFRTPMVGESDFPYYSSERVGSVRTYVGLEQPPRGDAGYSAWVEGIRSGRLYFSDGRSHFIDYRIDEHGVGSGDLALSKPRRVTVSARIAARLDETPISADEDHETPVYSYWHLERARIGQTRTVPLEIVVNGRPVARYEIAADGELRDFSAEIELPRSAWVALRILPSGHTALIYVTVAGKPIRASRRSAQWCLDCIDEVWRVKSDRIRTAERQQASAAYNHAREVYRRIKSECLRD